MEAIFISYRRETAAGSAGRLYDVLSVHFGKSAIFMDVDNIVPGDNFVEVLTRALSSCGLMIVVIDPRWLSVRDQQGRRRLDAPHDFLRLEIECAQKLDIRLLPVLVDGATMPHADELPPSISSLASRQAVGIAPSRFRSDTSRLISVIEQAMFLTHRSASAGRSTVFLANYLPVFPFGLFYASPPAIIAAIPWIIQSLWSFTAWSIIGSSVLSLLCLRKMYNLLGEWVTPRGDLVIGPDGIEIRGGLSPELISWPEVDNIVYTDNEVVVIPRRASNKRKIRVRHHTYEGVTNKSIEKAVMPYWS